MAGKMQMTTEGAELLQAVTSYPEVLQKLSQRSLV